MDFGFELWAQGSGSGSGLVLLVVSPVGFTKPVPCLWYLTSSWWQGPVDSLNLRDDVRIEAKMMPIADHKFLIVVLLLIWCCWLLIWDHITSLGLLVGDLMLLVAGLVILGY